MSGPNILCVLADSLSGKSAAHGEEKTGACCEIPEHRVGACVCGLAVRDKKSLYARDIFHDLRCTWSSERAGIKSFAALPLTSGDEVIGVIGLASDTERDFEQQNGFLETLASQVSIALTNAALRNGPARVGRAQAGDEQRYQFVSLAENSHDSSACATRSSSHSLSTRRGCGWLDWMAWSRLCRPRSGSSSSPKIKPSSWRNFSRRCCGMVMARWKSASGTSRRANHSG